MSDVVNADLLQEEEWKPHEGPQYDVLLRTEFEVGYGGARGGGKTEAGQAWLLYDSDHPLYRALVIRKNSIDLSEWLDRAERFYEAFGVVRVGTTLHFPNGGIIRTGHLKDDNAYMKYQGHEYQKMLIEELTQIASEKNYLMLLASCRSTVPGLKPQVFATFNPDGPGFFWVRKRFNIVGTPMNAIVTVDPKTGLSRVFVPSRLSDNPTLDADGVYRRFLDSLPDGLREAWRDGSWNDPVIQGAYYTAELLQARREGRIKLVPFDPALKVHTVWDLGAGDNMAILLVQRTKDETRIIDCMHASAIGVNGYWSDLQRWQQEKKAIFGKHFAPHDANTIEKGSGMTVVDQARGFGLVFEVVPKLGINDGISKARMMFPRVFINEGPCEQFLNAILNYHHEWDEVLLTWKEDPTKDWSSHYADAFRYLAVIEHLLTNVDVKSYTPEKRYQRPGLS